MANNLSAIKFKRRISGAAPTAAQIQRGELFLHLGNRTIYTKNESDQVIELGVAGAGGTIGGDLTVNGKLTVNQATDLKGTLNAGGTTLVWLDVTQNLKVSGQADVAAHIIGRQEVRAYNGEITLGKKGNDQFIRFSNANTMVRSNTNGQMVLGGIAGTDASARAIIFRPAGEANGNGESYFNTSGTLVLPRVETTTLVASGNVSLAGNVVSTGRMELNGAFVVANNATVNGALTTGGIIASGQSGERVQLHPGTNASVKFYGGNAIRAEIFGMTTGNNALQIRPVGTSANDMNLGTDGVLDVKSIKSRTNARILAADTSNWTSIIMADSSDKERGILFADREGAIGFRNGNQKIAVFNESNIWSVSEGSFNIGKNAGGDMRGNDPFTKGALFNKGFLECYGTVDGANSQSVNMIRAIHGGTAWVSSLYSERTHPDDKGNAYVQTVLAAQDGNNGAWFVFRHDGMGSIPKLSSQTGYFSGDIDANNVLIRSDRTVKKNIFTIESALEKVDCLSGSTYLDEHDTPSAGLIAQDVQKVLPEAVTIDDKNLLRLNYNSVVGLLVNAVKELREEVKQLRGK